MRGREGEGGWEEGRLGVEGGWREEGSEVYWKGREGWREREGVWCV